MSKKKNEPKPGDQYIIEIAEVILGYGNNPESDCPLSLGSPLYRIKGFNALVSDRKGLDRLRRAEEICDAYKRGFENGRIAYEKQPASQDATDDAYKRGWNECAEKIQNIKDAAYQNGLDDAWKLARLICMRKNDGGMSLGDMEAVFGTTIAASIFHTHTSASEVMGKIRAYEEEKSAIHIGDEVCFKGGKETFVVTHIGSSEASEDRFYSGVKRDGLSMGCRGNMLVKTGRHFDVSALLSPQGEDGPF